MRRFSDLKEAEAKEKEARLLGPLEPKFSTQEILEFRQIFDGFDGGETGEIGYPGMVKLLKQLLKINLTDAQAESLKSLVHEADDDQNGSLDFQEFLLLMRRMINENFAKIADAMRP